MEVQNLKNKICSWIRNFFTGYLAWRWAPQHWQEYLRTDLRDELEEKQIYSEEHIRKQSEISVVRNEGTEIWKRGWDSVKSLFDYQSRFGKRIITCRCLLKREDIMRGAWLTVSPLLYMFHFNCTSSKAGSWHFSYSSSTLFIHFPFSLEFRNKKEPLPCLASDCR